MKHEIFDDEDFKTIVRNSRSKEISELARLRYYDNVIIYGPAGIGKTVLLKTFQEENPVAYHRITFLHGHEIELSDSLLAPFLISRLQRPNVNAFPELVIIDDFDQVTSPSTREKVATMMKEGRQLGYRMILSARKQINEKAFEAHAHVVRIKGLSERNIDLLVEFFKARSDKHTDVALTIRGMLHELKGNPALIISHLIMLVTPDHFLYRNPILIEELERPTIIQANAPQIITDLRLVNKRILDRIGRQASEVYNLTPRQFEELVAELFEERGYQVELTKQTRDGGKDLIILDHREIGNFMIYAECKRHAPDNPVGVSVVSDLIGRMNADRATAGMVITSSYFSPDAKIFQSKFEHQMQLVDFVKLTSMIETIPQ